MKKLLFSCDDYIYFSKGKYYAGSKEKHDFFHRYLRVFEKVRLVARAIPEESIKESRVLLEDSRLEICPVSIFRGPLQYAKRYFEIGKALANVTDNCDAALLRLPSTTASRVYSQVRQAKLPYCVEVVFDAYDGFKTSANWAHRLLWWKIDRSMRQACYKANGVSCVTESYLQQRYYTRLPDGFSSHYSSVTLDKDFYFSARKYPNKKNFDIAHIANQIGFGGRKGQKELIEAASELASQGTTVNIKFAGRSVKNGAELLAQHAEKLGIGNQVEFVGFLSRPQLRQYLIDADLFVFPTRSEGLPRALIEAMAMGLPSVSTNASGIPELLQERFLIDYNDVSLLAARIKELVASTDLYEATSAYNFEKSKKYESSILEKRRDEFYGKLKQLTFSKAR